MKYNGQIERFFDEKGIEYDRCCANAEIRRGGNIRKFIWTCSGYQEVEFNEEVLR